MPDLLVFKIRFRFICATCKNPNEQNTVIKATSVDAAQQSADQMLIECLYCRASISGKLAAAAIVERSSRGADVNDHRVRLFILLALFILAVLVLWLSRPTPAH